MTLAKNMFGNPPKNLVICNAERGKYNQRLLMTTRSKYYFKQTCFTYLFRFKNLNMDFANSAKGQSICGILSFVNLCKSYIDGFISSKSINLVGF